MLSRTILAIEAVIVAYPTLLGFMLCFGAVAPVLTGSYTTAHVLDFIVGLAVLLSLVAGWRILLWVMMGGPGKGKSVNTIWWVFTIIGVVLTTAAWLLVGLETYGVYTLNKPNPIEMLLWGAYFIIPFVHLLIEVRWQKSANQALKHDAQKARAS